MHHKPSWVRTYLLVACLGSGAASLGAQGAVPNDPATEAGLKFARVYALVEQNYAAPIKPDHAIFDGAIRQMLNTLDPFSAFFDPQQFHLLQQQTRGEALGFGSIVFVEPGKIVVLQVAQGSPSWRAGLGPGDQIVQINGERVEDLDFQSMINLLKKSRSHPVRLGIIHPGQYVAQEVELRPAEVALPTADVSFVIPGDKIGYVHISGFDTKTSTEVETAVEKMGGSKLKGLLLDLRDNHGGVVATAVGVASLFLDPGVPVLTLRGRSVPEKTYHTARAATHFGMPLVVLVNGETASAAELLAAALEEHDRAVLAGEPTYGKGVVEDIYPLSSHTGLALTIAQYFTPSGRSIQRRLPGTALATTDSGLGKGVTYHTEDGRTLTAGDGITPDIVIPGPDLDPWLSFLERRGIFTVFASHYLSDYGKVRRPFEPDSNVLSTFRDFLGSERIRVPEDYWKSDRDYLRLRIKIEMISLEYGLSEGNKVRVEGDPQVQKALALFPEIPKILRGPAAKPAPRHSGQIVENRN